MRTEKVDPHGLDDEALAALLAGEPAYRVRQVRAWLRRGVDDPAEMSDLPLALRDRLAASLMGPPRILSTTSADAGLTRKILLACGSDGEAVESVLMLYPQGEGRSRGRATVCVSTQAGCAMGCPFCATGQAGFRRQLRLSEVVRQVAVAGRLLAGTLVTPHPVAPVEVEGAPDHVTNVVFMGMGEPLANLDVTVRAVRWLHDDYGLSARSITVSTVGLVPGIRRLAELGLPITLAVSLHAPDDELRDALVPPNRQHGLEALLAACDDYVATTKRRMTFEYVLIDGVNASTEQAGRLGRLVRAGIRRGPVPHVNLIPMNATPAVPWRAPTPEVQRAFVAALAAEGVEATIRHNRGSDIDAACGQLYADYAQASGRMLPAAVGAADRVDALTRA